MSGNETREGTQENCDGGNTTINIQQQTHGDRDANENGRRGSDAWNGVKRKVKAAVDKIPKKEQNAKYKANPPGGKDDAPLPSAPDGYTVRFIFHRAENLPIS